MTDGPSGASWSDLWRLKTALGKGLFLFSDLRTSTLMWQLDPVPCDGCGDEFRLDLHQNLCKALAALPEEEPPWVLQWFVGDEPARGLSGRDFCPGTDPLAERFANLLDRHLERCRSGPFRERGGNLEWRVKRRQVRLLLYRKPSGKPDRQDDHILEAARRLEEAMAVAGVQMRPMSGSDCLAWLGHWLTGLAPEQFGSDWPDDLAAIDACFAGSHHCDLPLRALAGRPVHSKPSSGCWCIGERWHAFLPMAQLSSRPVPGALTAELPHPEGTRSFWDQLPPGCQFSLCSLHLSASRLRSQLTRVQDRARGAGAEARAKRSACDRGLQALARGERIERVSAGLYLVADSEEQLREYSRLALALFASRGWLLVPPAQDHFHLDSWCSHLPGNFDPDGERRWFRRRSNLWYGDDLAAALPLYGRSRGTGTPGALFFNRGGEPLQCDPLSRQDRVRNAHSLIIGPTGSGKTALLIYLLLSMAARHRPRMFLVTTLPTFDLLGAWLEDCGLSLHRVRLKAGESNSIPPFAGALAALAGEGTDPGRDRINELELIASLMVAEKGRELQPWQSDSLREAVLAAARRKGADPMVEEVTEELRRRAADRDLPGAHRQSLLEMAGAMNRYTRGVAGAIFNRPGELWPDADCTLLDLGIAGRKGYEHLRTLAYISFIQRINDLIEATGSEQRQTLVVTDEAHVILGEPQLAAYLGAITAQWRTWGAWKWMVTQSLRQIPESSRSVLNMMEWWWCLGLDRDEVASVSNFRGLGEGQRELLLDTRKEPGKYVEAVVISDRLRCRFRSVLPALVLALSQTEKEERAERTGAGAAPRHQRARSGA